MASGPHHQQTQDHHMQPQQQQNHRMQFVASHTTSLGSVDFNLQHQQLHHNTMLPNASIVPLATLNHGQIIPVNPHQHQTTQPQQHRHDHQQQSLMGSIVSSGIISSAHSNQSSNHIQQQQQESQILPPSLLSPRPPSLTPNSTDQTEQSDDNDVIDNVISLHNDYSDTSAILPVVANSETVTLSLRQQHIQHQLCDNNFVGADVCLADNNHFSSSSEDLINLLSQYPLDSSDLRTDQQLDQDEKIESIEIIRKQLMSCEVQSEHQNTNSMSPIINQSIICQNQPTSTRTNTQLQPHDNAHQQQVPSQQLISQIEPVITHQHQQQTPHQITTPTPGDQTLLHASYSNIPMSNVPVSSSGQSYAPQQQQHVTRISQSNPMPIVNSSPTPTSWQQPQLSPYSPQNPHNNSRTPSHRQGQQHHPTIQHHQTTTSPQIQQMYQQPLQQQISPSQSVSPPVTSEPSPVVKKNPLLNAQLVNTRAPSITPTRFMNSNQANVLNQNPILNAKLSQSPFVPNNANNTSVVGSPVNPSLNPQSRFMPPQNQQTTNFTFDISNRQQNAQQQGQMNIYGIGDQQQPITQIFRTSNTGSGMTAAGGVSSMNMGNTSPTGVGLSQQVKQEIRRKVQQPKQQHQKTSLLKQLLSDDTK